MEWSILTLDSESQSTQNHAYSRRHFLNRAWSLPNSGEVNQDWEIRGVIGKEVIDSMLYYLIDWQPTVLPRHSLGHAEQLVDEFESRIQAKRGLFGKRGGTGSKPRPKVSIEPEASRSAGEKALRPATKINMNGKCH